VNSNGKIGLDGTGMRAGPGTEKRKLTRLVEPSGSGINAILRSKGFRSAYERRRHNKKVSMLLVCAAAIIIVSGFAMASFGNGGQPTVPGRISIPPMAFIVRGHTYDASSAVIPNCNVNITNMNTGNYTNVLSDSLGVYRFDISVWVPAYQVGDIIRVVANTTTMTGTNQGTITATPYLILDVTLSTPIPEFTDIAIPIVGMISIFAVARVASSRREEEQP